MSYNSKKNICNILTEVIVFISYIIFANSRYAPSIEDLKAWSIVILSIAIMGTILVIFVQIIFHIISTICMSIKENRTDVEMVRQVILTSTFIDERDRLINLRANKISNTFLVGGFVVSIFLLLEEPSIFFIFQFLFGVFWFSAIVGEFANIYFYETGTLHE